MSRFEIYLSKNDLEHIANGHDIKIKINGKIFLTTNEIILKPALMNDVMAPINEGGWSDEKSDIYSGSSW